MSGYQIYHGCPIFDGEQFLNNHGLVVHNGIIEDIIEGHTTSRNAATDNHVNGYIVPGLVDLQVNGGGGTQFNDDPTYNGIAAICQAHLALGSTAILVTLITASRDTTTRAINAAIKAQEENIPGFLGLHLEGPHLATPRKGAHKEEYIRPMKDNDLQQLLDAKKHLKNLMVTVAPESVTNDQISILSDAGVIVSIGHSNATFDQTNKSAQAGAISVTHLFNAMSPLGHREPGVVGAALANGNLHTGLIADGHHVHRDVISLVTAAKSGPGQIYLVSDAMAPIGTNQTSFTLDGRKILRKNGRLTLQDGTLAGADVDLVSCLKVVNSIAGIGLENALKMATTNPASVMAATKKVGLLKPGSAANFINLDEKLNVLKIWYQGDPIDEIQA